MWSIIPTDNTVGEAGAHRAAIFLRNNNTLKHLSLGQKTALKSC
jgi:hypothetical protein